MTWAARAVAYEISGLQTDAMYAARPLAHELDFGVFVHEICVIVLGRNVDETNFVHLVSLVHDDVVLSPFHACTVEG